jgi:hypothetical protein
MSSVPLRYVLRPAPDCQSAVSRARVPQAHAIWSGHDRVSGHAAVCQQLVCRLGKYLVNGVVQFAQIFRPRVGQCQRPVRLLFEFTGIEVAVTGNVLLPDTRQMNGSDMVAGEMFRPTLPPIKRCCAGGRAGCGGQLIRCWPPGRYARGRAWPAGCWPVY